MNDESPTMTDSQLAAYLQEMERQAASYRNTELADEQAVAIEFYDGKIVDEADLVNSPNALAPILSGTKGYVSSLLGQQLTQLEEQSLKT